MIKMLKKPIKKQKERNLMNKMLKKLILKLNKKEEIKKKLIGNYILMSKQKKM